MHTRNSRDEELFEFLQEKRNVITVELATYKRQNDARDADTREKIRGVLFKVDQALSALENGKYGKCCTCGSDIQIRSLKINFQFVRCDECHGKVHTFPRSAS